MRLWLLSLLFLACPAHAAADAPPAPAAGLTAAPRAQADSLLSDAYVGQLLDTVDRLQLYKDRYWHVLLHYKRGLRGVRSLVDDPKFFADPNGKHDPRAELRATIRAFFTPLVANERHPVCRFVGRYEWLREKLDLDSTRLPVPACDEFEQLIARIRPESASLSFPTSHMNSPASMYGHTLLTIETASKSKLLSYAINYSALTLRQTIAPVYMAKGLFGGYPGYFSILPYYAKLQEYSDVNDRDIWEYPLNLDRREVRRLLLHVSELDNIYSDYFFFKENCSYDLLFLLEAARPSLRLTDRFRWWVIPLDTIREVRKGGMIQEAIYRPSRSTKVAYLSGLLSKDYRREAGDIVKGLREPGEVLAQGISDEQKIRVLDLASEYLQYTYAKGDLPKDAYVPRFLHTLQARSGLGESGDWRYAIAPPTRPDDGHRSNRLAVGAGGDEGEPFQEIRLRPAYHAMLDNSNGYKMGSQIIFVDTAVRYYSRAKQLRLQEVDLIDIVSLAPRQEFFPHTSWKVKTGFFRRTLRDGRAYTVYGLNPGLGRAYDLGAGGLSYALLETDLHVAGALNGSYSLGGGASAGVIKDLTGWWRARLSARYLDYPLGHDTRTLQLGLDQSILLGTNLSLSIAMERRTEFDDADLETTVSGNVFF